MRKGLLIPLLMFVAVAGSMLLLGSSTTTTHSHDSLRRRTQLDAPATEVNPLFADPNALNPKLAMHLMNTIFNSEEEIEVKRERYQYMVRYHSGMRPPCLHKSFYGMIGLVNPKLTEGMTEDEKERSVLFYGRPSGRKLMSWFGASETP